METPMKLSKLQTLAEARRPKEVNVEADFDALKSFVNETFDSLEKTLASVATSIESDLGDLTDKIGGPAKETNSLEELAGSMSDVVDVSEEVAAVKAAANDFVQDLSIQLKSLKGTMKVVSKTVKDRRAKITKLLGSVGV
jgi:archaellum component FlaC